MSILSSLFGSKKRGKKPASSTAAARSTSPSPLHKQKVRASSPTNDRGGPSRFLSLRRKSSAGPDAVLRRSSGESSRKKQGGAGEEWKLPDLGFVDEGKGEREQESGLGLGNVGGVSKLSREEKKKLAGVSLGAEQVGKFWNALGVVLKDTDLKTILLDTPLGELEDQDYALRSLVLVAASPERLADFPSIASHYPSAPSTDARAVWSDRLLELTRSTQPHAVASALRWSLRRFSSPSNTPLISSAAYIKFVQAEHAASYPAEAYHTIFAVNLPSSVRKVLHEIFDVWAALAAQAQDQSGLGGKLSLLMGWWILRPEMGAGPSWEELYAEWRLAARRIEHLFLTWIRHQSTTHTLPTRLLALVAKYPYGHSEYSAETLPSPLPSSFTRRTLHLSLQTDQPLAKLSLSPADILKSARAAKAADDAGLAIWEAISAVPQGGDEVGHLVDDESTAFLAKFQDDHIPVPQKVPPSPSRRTSLFEGRGEPVPLARVTSNAKMLDTLAEEVGKLAEGHSNPAPISHKSSRNTLRIPESTSTWDDFTKSGFGEERNGDLTLQLTPSPSVATFSSVARDPPAPRPVLATPTASPRKATFAPVAKFTTTHEEVIDTDDMFIAFTEDGQLDPPSSSNWPSYTLLRLRTPYTSNGDVIERLLITVEYRAPPPPPVTPSRSLANEFTPPSASPTGESSFRFGSFGFKRSTSKPGMGFRQSFFSSSRVSLLKDDSGADFITEPETIYKNASGSAAATSVDNLALRKSKTPPDVAERKARKPVPPFLPAARVMSGSLSAEEPTAAALPPPSSGPAGTAASAVVAPGVPEPAVPIAAPLAPPSPSAVSPTATKGSRPVLALATSSLPADEPSLKPIVTEAPLPPASSHTVAFSNKGGSTRPALGPSAETTPNEWIYGAEGGAHVVFMYTGKTVPFIGKLLRIRKISTHRGDPIEESSAKWRDELLPRLVPDRLLVKTEKIQLEGEWLRALLEGAEPGRAEDRKANGSLVEEIGTEPNISLMENLRVTDGRTAGTRVLSVEIKPKWGFLPSAEHIQPPGAAAIKSQIGRYTLHQHYRGKTPAEGSYDPLDLFSGDEERIKHALVGLWGIWRETGGQANSFRVFVDGNIVHPDEADTEGSLLRVTAPILIPLLQNSDILPVLRHLQSTLDPTDISDLVARYQAAHPDTPLFDESIVPDISPSELTAFINKYLYGVPPADWSLRDRIISYYLSAIFKDCSIIIRAVLSPAAPEEAKWVVENRGSTVRLLDLDLKPLKMRHWAELDEKIWRYWAETKGKGGELVKAGEGDVAAKSNGGEAPALVADADRDIIPSPVVDAPPPETTSWVSAPPVPTPGVGDERIVPGGFPGIPDVPISTPSLTAGPSNPLANSDEATAPAFTPGEPEVSTLQDTRTAYAWYIRWFDGLEEASKCYFAEQNVQGMLDALAPLHELIDRTPETAEERSFIQSFGQDLQMAIGYLENGVASTEVDLQNAWDLYYKVFQRIHKQLKTLGLVQPPLLPPNGHFPDPRLAQARLPFVEAAETSNGIASADVVQAKMKGNGDGNGANHESREETGAVDVGTESASSSVFSTPMVPGAFNFPDMSGTPIQPAIPAEPIPPTSIDLPPHPSTFGPPSSSIISSPPLPQSLEVRSPIPPIADLSETASLADVDSEAESPVDSRYERSFAPSPSPALAPDLSPDAGDAESPTPAIIALNSPPFGRVRSIESVETIESGSSITEESSPRLSDVELVRADSITPTTPPPRSPRPASIVLGSTAATPTQRTFPNLGPALPYISPRSSSIPAAGARQSPPVSPSSSVRSFGTPSRPERRRIDSISKARSASRDGTDRPVTP